MNALDASEKEKGQDKAEAKDCPEFEHTTWTWTSTEGSTASGP